MYKLQSTFILRLSDSACIPADPANIDYAQYLAWLAEGNTPEPTDPPTPPTALEQIRALEARYADAQARVTRQALLALALDKAMLDPAAARLTREEVHAILLMGDNGYSQLWALEQQIATLRAA